MKILRSRGRFYTKTGGAELLYSITDDGIMSIYHTFVPEGQRGKGIAEKLAAAAFGFAESGGFRVRPDCPYILHFLEEHPEFRRLAVA